MNGKINADLKSLEFIFNRNKFYILPAVIVLVCIVLFFQFIIPQFKTFLLARNEVKEISLRLETLRENLNVLINTNENSLDSQLKILNLALPQDKDFSGILNSIHHASIKAGVIPGTFLLQIGDLLNSEKSDKVLFISLSIPISGDVIKINDFVKTISNTFPLSETSFVKIRGEASAINLLFYYKPVDSFNNNDIRISPLTQKGFALINELRGFENILPVTSSGD